MRRALKIIDEAVIFISMLAGVYLAVSFLIISLFSQLQNL